MNAENHTVHIDFNGKVLIIGTETSSGGCYKINSKKELLGTVCNYILDILDKENEYRVQVSRKVGEIMNWLYEPKGKENEYPVPIHSEDNMLTGFSFQSIIDSFNASVEEKTEKNLKLFIQNTVRMTLDDMWDNYDLTREMLLKECGIKGDE